VSASRPAPYSFDEEISDDGSFRRQPSQFRCSVAADGTADIPVEAGRYHLYVARACPWAHRTIIARGLMGLEHAIGISFVDPIRDERGWAFSRNGYEDPVNGFEFLSQAYVASSPGYPTAGVTVPVLWDKESSVIVCNESPDIVRLMGTAFAELAEHPVELYPRPLRAEIDELNDHIYDNVNNAVYKAGFARHQEIYEREVHSLFAALDGLDHRLAATRFLFGPSPVETDWRLFTTLLRFDSVYNTHFKCTIRKLAEYEQLWPYARDLYQWPGVAETVSFDEIRAHYYVTHPSINPNRIIAVMPANDWSEPPERDRLS
jgi:glutathionyl-hydroquinone reductase